MSSIGLGPKYDRGVATETNTTNSSTSCQRRTAHHNRSSFVSNVPPKSVRYPETSFVRSCSQLPLSKIVLISRIFASTILPVKAKNLFARVARGAQHAARSVPRRRPRAQRAMVCRSASRVRLRRRADPRAERRAGCCIIRRCDCPTRCTARTKRCDGPCSGSAARLASPPPRCDPFALPVEGFRGAHAALRRLRNVARNKDLRTLPESLSAATRARWTAHSVPQQRGTSQGAKSPPVWSAASVSSRLRIEFHKGDHTLFRRRGRWRADHFPHGARAATAVAGRDFAQRHGKAVMPRRERGPEPVIDPSADEKNFRRSRVFLADKATEQGKMVATVAGPPPKRTRGESTRRPPGSGSP
jgi:hypothetical protein